MMVADFVTRQQNGSPLNGEIPGQNHHANSNMPAHSALLMSNNSSNSNSSGRASPHTSSESEFPQNGYELAAHLKRKELFSQRKQREFIPDNKKDDSYWDRRRRNNEAAKRSREKRRFNDMVLEQRVVELTKENHVLKAQLDAIKSKYNICGENLVSVDQIMATLPTNEQVLSSTKRVKLSNGGAGGRSTSPGGQSVSMFPLSRSPSRQRTASPTQSDPSGPTVGPVEGGSPHLQLSQPSPTPSSQQAPVIHPNPNIESPPPQGVGLASPPVHSSTGAIQHTGSLPVHAIYRSIEYERGNGEVVHGKVSPPLTGRSPSQIRLELLERNLDLDHQHHHHHLHQHQQQLGQHGQQGQHHLQPHHHPLHHQLQPSHQHHHHQHQYGHHQHQREVIRESVIDHRGEHHHPGTLQHHQLQQQQQQQQQPQPQHIHHSNHHHRVLAANGGHELVVDDRDDRSPSPPAPSVARFGSPTTTTTTTTASHAASPPAATAATSSTSPSGSAGSPPAHLPLAAHSHHFPSHHHPHPHHPHHLHHPYVLGATSPYATSSSTSSPPASAAAVASLPASYTTVAAAAAVAAYAAGGLYGGSPPRHHPAELLSPSVALTLTANVLNLSRRAPSPYETAASGSGASPPRSASSGAEDEPDVGRDTGRELHEHANSLPVKLRHKSHLGDKDAASALLALQNIKQEPVGSLRSSSPSWDDGGDGGCSSDERDSGISTNEWPTKAEQKMMPASPPAAAGSSSGSAGGGAAIASTAAMMAKITSIPASVVISKKTEENIHLQSKLARLESEVATIKNMMISSTAGSAFGVTAAAQ